MAATLLFMGSAINDVPITLYLYNMEQVSCRTCLDLTDKAKCKEIWKPCCLDKTTEEYKTVKDVIFMLVPQMVFNIFGNDYVCGNCLRTLKASFQFIERCLEVERLNAEKEARENQYDVDEFSENEAKNTDLEEDVIIPLDNDLQQVELDHNYYIKIEPDDSDDLNSENEVEINENNAPGNYSVPIEIVPEKLTQKNKDLDVKNDTSKSPAFMLYDSLSLYNETQDVYNVNLEGSLSQESVSVAEDLVTKNSQSTSLIPPKNEKPMQKKKDLNIKNDTIKSPAFMMYNSLSLYNKTQDVYNVNVDLEGNLSQESLSVGEDLDTKNSQSTSLIPPKNEKPTQKKKDLNIKNDMSKSPAFMLYDSLSLHNKTQDVYNVNVDLEGNLSQESVSVGEDLDTKNSQSTSLVPPKNDKFRCVICSEKFTCRSDYNCHLDIHPPFICDYCGKGYKTNCALKCHARYHKEKYALCEFCGKPFAAMGSLNLHISCVHANGNKYMCDRCPKRFKSEFRLRFHTRVVHEKARQQQCPECGKLFRIGEACKSHYRLVHLKLKPFVCHVCGQEFGRKDYLDKHMYDHTGDPKLTKIKTLRRKLRFGFRLNNSGKPVECKVCGKKTSSVHSLKAHLQTHVKIKRHKCQFCDLTFSLVGSRNRHEQLHDSDPENKFRCNICWKRVKTKEELETHVKGHYIGRPPQYSCDVCEEKFHRRYLLDNHLLDQHTDPEDIKKAEEEIVIKNLLEYTHPSS